MSILSAYQGEPVNHGEEVLGMAFLCFLGAHKWNGCTCSACGTTKDSDHIWNCGKHLDANHDWLDALPTSKCTVCGRAQEEFKAALREADMISIRAINLDNADEIGKSLDALIRCGPAELAAKCRHLQAFRDAQGELILRSLNRTGAETRADIQRSIDELKASKRRSSELTSAVRAAIVAWRARGWGYD